jgi:hypothetical protein
VRLYQAEGRFGFGLGAVYRLPQMGKIARQVLKKMY